VLVGALQSMTQMHEPTIGLIPRLASVLLVVLAVLPWMLGTWVAYAVNLIGSLPDRF
jgi:flagellar biosynthesis protein FliQ